MRSSADRQVRRGRDGLWSEHGVYNVQSVSLPARLTAVDLLPVTMMTSSIICSALLLAVFSGSSVSAWGHCFSNHDVIWFGYVTIVSTNRSQNILLIRGFNLIGGSVKS